MADEMKLTQMHNGAVERLVDPRKIWAIVKKNWMVLKADTIRLIPLFMFPILMITVFGFASGSLPKHISAAIVDYDRTDFSQSVQDSISSMELFSVHYVVGTQDEGKQLMDEGKVKVLFILPEGLGDKVKAGQPAEIQLMVDESDSSVAQIAKSSAQQFAQQLSAQVTDARLAAIASMADSARGDVGAATASAAGIQTSTPLSVSTSAYETDMRSVYAQSSGLIGGTIQGTKNSLGYLVDQNEIAQSFSPTSVASATLALLAVGDSQQLSLQQIALYQAMGGTQAKIFSDAQGIYANFQKLAAQSSSQAQSSQAAASRLGAASVKLQQISAGASSAHAPIEVSILEPYGYGRKGIDFLLASILALTIFQGATMGLGRAIAGERKDGSLTRVFLTPTSNVTIIMGTQLFYMLLETVRSTMLIIAAIALFSVSITGSMVDIVIVVAIFAMGATGVGMVLSVLAKNQEQYMALAMLVSLPMMFLSGVFFPIQTMPAALQAVAEFLPITYAADALRGIMVKGFTLAQVLPDVGVLIAFAAATMIFSLLMFKRELV